MVRDLCYTSGSFDRGKYKYRAFHYVKNKYFNLTTIKFNIDCFIEDFFGGLKQNTNIKTISTIVIIIGNALSVSENFQPVDEILNASSFIYSNLPFFFTDVCL